MVFVHMVAAIGFATYTALYRRLVVVVVLLIVRLLRSRMEAGGAHILGGVDLLQGSEVLLGGRGQVRHLLLPRPT
jgi:hypothetical protein